MIEQITADWPAPARVCTLQTTRNGGVSLAPYASLNLGAHVGDAPEAVQTNRGLLEEFLPAAPLWLEQVHGTCVFDLEGRKLPGPADAVVCRSEGKVCAIMTADCLPVLLCNREGTVVGAAHAGWRGLLAGVLENTVSAMDVAGGDILAWLGPAIGPTAFEVGEEVRSAFLQQGWIADSCFVPGAPGKYFADIYALARLRLKGCGVEQVFGGGECTYSRSERYFSYRRDGCTGRMASLIWLEGS